MIYSSDGHSSLAFDNERDIYFPYSHACCNISPSVFSTTSLARDFLTIPSYAIRRDVQVRRLAVHEGMLQSIMDDLVGLAREWIELGELMVVLAPNRRLVWPHSIYRERERILGPGAVVEEAEGWGDVVVLNRLMRELEGASKKEGRGTFEWKIPVLKVVQPRVMDKRDDPFCVKLTPLSLRK